MPLPLCVRIERTDENSRKSLVEDGWKEIGNLNTYRGILFKSSAIADCRFSKTEEDKAYAFKLSDSIEWKSRLFRDGHAGSGHKANIHRISLAHRFGRLILADGGFLCILPEEFGFTIDLIGVAEAARGKKLAPKMIRFARNSFEEIGPWWVQAGTYDDNEPAKRLYERLGMTVHKRHIIFHKSSSAKATEGKAS